jgi:hypothetical protein
LENVEPWRCRIAHEDLGAVPLALYLFSGAVNASGVVLNWNWLRGCRATSLRGISAEHVDVHVGGENDWDMGRGRYSCLIVTNPSSCLGGGRAGQIVDRGRHAVGRLPLPIDS